MAKSKDKGFSWCPQCKCWVPEELMNYDINEETGQLVRVCTPCLEGESNEGVYIREEHHEDTRCLHCGSYDTVEQPKNDATKASLKWNWFKCNTCGKIFRRMY